MKRLQCGDLSERVRRNGSTAVEDSELHESSGLCAQCDKDCGYS